ncbi:MAG: N-acetylglucosamine kinase [Sphingobacteriales bacterium]|nr:MAG: N-acetylglucosamine kinase [Sphingobacteriales bacterium]
MPYILVADSGSTKTDWSLIKDGKTKKLSTTGINPYFVSETSGAEILANELKIGKAQHDIAAIHFYSAGVKAPQNKKLIEQILKHHFGIKNIFVHSDMLGAARATCGYEKGVTAILGTGSNSCFFDGNKITKQRASLGYIIGDEGSGTYLGKKVLQYFFYDTFDGDLHEAFINKYGNDLPAVLERIYKQPLPNRYLAGFTEFLQEHRGHYMVENIVEDSFLEFFNANILKYRESWKYPINFVGSVAHTFKDVLENIAAHYGVEIGTIAKSPMEGLVKYHK